MENCKKCGAILVDGDKFCRQCGEAADLPVNKNVCANCGNVIQEGMTFCDKCGQCVEPPRAYTRPAPTPMPAPAPAPTPVPIPAPAPVYHSTSTDNSFGSSAIWAIVLAFLAPIIAWNWYDAFGLILSIVSLVLGFKSQKSAAKVCGVISVVIVVFMFIYAYA